MKNRSFLELIKKNKIRRQKSEAASKWSFLNSSLFCMMLLSASIAHGTYEGTYAFCHHGKVDLSWLEVLLPYNPVIVDVGTYYGEDLCRAPKIWPKAKIFALEPNPRAFSVLQKNIKEKGIGNIQTECLAISDHDGTDVLFLSRGPRRNDPAFEHTSSLLPVTLKQFAYRNEPNIEVPCMTLDSWRESKNIEKIDVLILDTEGFELQALQASPGILNHVQIICVQTFFAQDRMGRTDYSLLRDYLRRANFVVLAHWYTEGDRGSAVYVSQEMFDALFVKCWGLGIGGMQFP